MKYDIYGNKIDASSEWEAVEKWMDEENDLQAIMDCEITVYVSDEHGNATEFTLDKSMEEFVANRADGKPWVPKKTTNQTFHLGVSCYGPNKDGKFCGSISVESTTIHRETYNTLDEARQESLGKLLESITVTLGFSRTEAIERLGKECNDRRKNSNSDERASVDG